MVDREDVGNLYTKKFLSFFFSEHYFLAGLGGGVVYFAPRVFRIQPWISGFRTYSSSTVPSQLPLPEEPDTDDETEIRKWKWKVKAVKKENSERHSHRCDIELKLAVSSFLILIPASITVY